MKKAILLLAVILLTATGAAAKDTNGTLRVQGKCNMCKTKIEKAAKSVEGVSVAEWNKETKVLRLRFDNSKVKLSDISQAVAKIGYDTDKDKAPDAAYSAMPDCCKYRE
ncbi:MAG: cation transporter [Tannerellaceae bacterium]|jgi:Cu(I)/Ag(I) efflux system membrane fusion protein|nr:cation transporter [Tannerellaceae bacterium]